MSTKNCWCMSAIEKYNAFNSIKHVFCAIQVIFVEYFDNNWLYLQEKNHFLKQRTFFEMWETFGNSFSFFFFFDYKEWSKSLNIICTRVICSWTLGHFSAMILTTANWIRSVGSENIQFWMFRSQFLRVNQMQNTNCHETTLRITGRSSAGGVHFEIPLASVFSCLKLKKNKPNVNLTWSSVELVYLITSYLVII